MRERRPREPTSRELALWRHAMRDVRPLATAPDPLPPPPEPPEPPEPATGAAIAPKPDKLASRLLNGAARSVAGPSGASVHSPPAPVPGTVDRRTRQRLQRGLYPISARLDLHGLSQTEAHARLSGFITSQHGRGARCVLVITGRGLRSGGVLRSQTPRWLSTPPLAEKVQAFAAAGIGHGGEGALYVLLRRKRGP